MGLVGRLEDLGISDIFQILGIGKKTGTLMIKSARGKAFIGFRDGLIIRAETNAFETSLSEDLASAGQIKPSTFKMASEVKKSLPEKSLVEILLDLEAIKKEAVEKFARKRIEKVVFETMQWVEGEFIFELEEESPNGGIPEDSELKDFGWKLAKGLSPEYLLMEGARVSDERTKGIMDEGEIESLAGEDSAGEGWDGDWGGSGQRKDISSLKALTQELRFPNSTSEITLLVLRFASDIFRRGVLFMAAPDELAGLGQFGLEMEDADLKIRQTVIKLEESPFLSEVVKTGRSYRGPLPKEDATRFFISEMGGEWPPQVAIFPLVAEGNVVALLYCDNIGEDMPESEGLEIFISHAGMALEKALLQRRIHELEKNKKY